MSLFPTVSVSHEPSPLLPLSSVSVFQLFVQSPDLLALEIQKSYLRGAQSSWGLSPAALRTWLLLGYDRWVFIPIKRRTQAQVSPVRCLEASEGQAVGGAT